MADVVTCWCGVKGPASELYDTAGLEFGCNGWGDRVCRCGGDQCVCHHHGSVPCNGCADCEEVSDAASR